MPIPGAWSQIPIIGTFVGFDGKPAAGKTITFTSKYPLTVSGQVFGERVFVAVLDANGAIPAGFTLPSTNDPDISPLGWAYTVHERFDGGRSPFDIYVPYNASSVDMATVDVQNGLDVVSFQASVQATAVAAANTLRADIASAASGKGAALVGYQFPAAGSGARTSFDRISFDFEVSVMDFITDPAVRAAVRAGTNSADLSAYVQAARNYLQTNSYYRGGKIKFPRGIYKLNSELAFTAYSAQLVHNIYLEGEGPQNTVLDFSGCAVNTDGVTFDTGSHFGVKDMTIISAKRHGIVVGRGTTVGGAGFCSFYEIDNVRVQSCLTNGVHSQNSYMGTYRNVWTRDNGGSGFNMAGFHTSMKVDRVEASGNTVAGFTLNGLVYSHFSGCGADNNGTQGYALSNMQGVVFTACGAESNGRDGWLAYTSNASATGLTAQETNIRGVLLEGCYGINNSLSVAGGYAGFFGAATADSRSIEVTLKNCVSHPGTGSDKALILQGSSGAITVHKEAFDDAAYVAADTVTGTVEVRNTTMAGRRCLLLSSGAQSIANSTDAPVTTWNTTPSVNDMGATTNGTTITIPRGVNKARVTAQVAWATVAGGTTRNVKLLKNGAGFAGQAQVQQAPLGINIEQVTTGVISVAAGDTFQVNVFQDQGGAVALRTGPDNNVWFTVEAVC